jgi:hypothetical protein
MCTVGLLLESFIWVKYLANIGCVRSGSSFTKSEIGTLEKCGDLLEIPQFQGDAS